jgi:hypothetical protein
MRPRLRARGEEEELVIFVGIVEGRSRIFGEDLSRISRKLPRNLGSNLLEPPRIPQSPITSSSSSLFFNDFQAIPLDSQLTHGFLLLLLTHCPLFTSTHDDPQRTLFITAARKGQKAMKNMLRN